MDKIYYNVNSDELEKILLSNYYFKSKEELKKYLLEDIDE